MTRHVARARPAVRFAFLPWAMLAVALSGTAALGQNVDLPVPDLTVSVGASEVTLDWPEISVAEGRAVTNRELIAPGGWDYDNSSDLALVGAYALDCDFRIRISKVPRENGFNRKVQLVYSIFENTTGVGAPRDADTLEVFEPDVEYYFESDIAGNLGMRFTATLEDPPGPLGNMSVTISGMNTANAVLTGFFAAALDSATVDSGGMDTLLVEVLGPVDLDNIPNPIPPSVPRDTLAVTIPGEVFPIQNGMSISFGEGFAAPGDTAKWTEHYLFDPQGTISADLEVFGGYHVWRAEIPRGGGVGLGAPELMGEIRQCESKFTFVLLDVETDRTEVLLIYDLNARQFTFHDRSVHDDFPYEYALSTFDRGFLGNVENLTWEGDPTRSGKLYPAAATRGGGDVYVVPNPYKKSADWEEGGESKVVFSNLPDVCTIRVFSSAGDHLTTLEHGPGLAGSTSPTSRNWNLKNSQGVPIAPGIYIFHVESDTLRQEGKMVVAR